MPTKHFDVLVAGAGPTGLTLALYLASHGVRVAVVDKKARRSEHSKALAMQAGPLELFANAFGPDFSDSFVAAGRPTHEACIHVDSAAPVRIALSGIPSRFNYILIIEQSATEKILEEALNERGVTVLRETELIRFMQSSSGVEVTLRREGKDEQVTANFLAGCDGAHSVVRHSLAIAFEGGAYEGTFLLGDVRLSWPWPYGSIQTFVNARGTMACFPLPAPQRYRLIAAPKNLSLADDLTLEELETVARDISASEIHLLEGSWLTRFRTHHRVAKSFQSGRVFLAGDAAHIHSPVGGQGMNTGITDALNLGAKLVRVIGGKAPPEILLTYEKERLPVARRLVQVTDIFTRAGLTQEFSVLNRLRANLLPFIARIPLVQRIVARLISQVGPARREIERF